MAGLRAGAQPTLAVEPADSTVVPGSTFEVRVLVNHDVSDLMGFNVTLWIDSLVLRVQDVEEGALFKNRSDTFFRWLDEGIPTNSISFLGSVLGGTVAGPGEVCRLTFEARNAGASVVAVFESDLRDSTNAVIAHATQDAVIHVTAPVAIRRVHWGEIKNVFR
jgi:hypothetical protein